MSKCHNKHDKNLYSVEKNRENGFDSKSMIVNCETMVNLNEAK